MLPLPSEAASDLAALRRTRPLTHCLTGSPARMFIANALLAAGASSAMVASEEEVAAFAAAARAVLVNLGSVTPPLARAMHAAVAAARAAGTPWVLDPAAIGAALPTRTALATALLAAGPAIVKGNASEILTLSGGEGGGSGPDATASVAAALPAAEALARRTGAVVVVTGPVDALTDGQETRDVPGGDALMPLVTGTGCALGGLMAALLGAGVPPWRAAQTGCAAFADAGAAAARHAAGPGSFAPAFLDRLYALGR